MTDDEAFKMHMDYPLDDSMLAYTRKQGFGEEQAGALFEEWRTYWVGRPDEMRTARGWIATWQRHLREKARRVVAGKPVKGNGQAGGLPKYDHKQTYLSTAFGALEERAKGWPISEHERQALREWGESAPVQRRARLLGVSAEP